MLDYLFVATHLAPEHRRPPKTTEQGSGERARFAPPVSPVQPNTAADPRRLRSPPVLSRRPSIY